MPWMKGVHTDALAIVSDAERWATGHIYIGIAIAEAYLVAEIINLTSSLLYSVNIACSIGDGVNLTSSIGDSIDLISSMETEEI